MNINSYIKNKKIIKKISSFNKKIFTKKTNFSDEITLCEFTTNKSVQASFSIFTNYMQKNTKQKLSLIILIFKETLSLK